MKVRSIFFFLFILSFQLNAEQPQLLSIHLLPVSPVPMETNLTKDSSLLNDRPPSGTIITTVFRPETNDDDYRQRIPVNRLRNSPSMKMKLFIRRYKDLIVLVLKSIGPDLKSFKWWQICILILFATFSVVFSVLDFNSFLPKSNVPSLLKWTNLASDNVALWRRILLCLSGVSAFTNVLNVVLVIRGKISCYFWGILGAILYGTFAFAFSYVGDAQLYILFFLPMQFVGVYIWSRELDNQSTTRVKSLTWIGWIIVVVLSVGLGASFFYEIPAFSRLLTSEYAFDDKLAPHILDACTNSLSVIGQFLLIFCYWEQYIFWLTVNILGIIMYSGVLDTGFDINTLLVWIMFAINSIVGCYTWFRRSRQTNASNGKV